MGHVEESNVTPAGYQQITDLDTAVGLTVPTGATRALIQATTQSVRWRDDDTDPTDTVGMQLAAGADMWYLGDLSRILFVQEAASAKLNVSYYL